MKTKFILFLLIFIVGTLFVSLASAETPTYKQNQAIQLTAVCDNCTFVNLTNADTITAKVIQGTSPLKLSAGIVNVVLNDSSNTTDFSHDIRINGTSIQPACDVSARGTLRFGKGASGFGDTLEICVKLISDLYAWKTVSLI